LKLFVYGTLKRGKSANYLLQNATFIREARAPGFVLLDLSTPRGDYPGMVRGDGTVEGELFEVGEIEPIDAFEDHPFLFVRTEIDLECGTRAAAYLSVSARGKKIGGSW